MKKQTDDSVSLGFSSSVPICSICHTKTKIQKNGLYECPQCQRTYDPDREIVEYEDTLISSHQDEMPEIEGTGGGGGSLMCSEEGSAVDDLYKQQRRLGVRPDENVIEYYEYIPDVDRAD